MEHEFDMAQVLAELGGISTRARLVEATSRASVDAALRCGVIVADARDRYALPATDEAVRRAAALSGLLSLTSAALHHGWEVKTVPERPHITVPRKRRVSPDRRAGVELHRCDVHPDDVVDGIATGIELTLAQCLTRLPFDEALAVADSALRHGVPPATLRRVAQSVRGPGAPQARRVAELANGRLREPIRVGAAFDRRGRARADGSSATGHQDAGVLRAPRPRGRGPAHRSRGG